MYKTLLAALGAAAVGSGCLATPATGLSRQPGAERYAQYPHSGGEGTTDRYESKHGRGAAHGRHAESELPPGIAKNLRRGKRLPPGIAKRRVPDYVVRKLPPVPRGCEYLEVAGKILLVEIATQKIRDVLLDAVTN